VIHPFFSCRKYDGTRTAIGLTPDDLNGKEEGTIYLPHGNRTYYKHILDHSNPQEANLKKKAQKHIKTNQQRQ
jgi:hypothetical protein